MEKDTQKGTLLINCVTPRQETAVHNAIVKLNADGTLDNRKRSGRPRKTTPRKDRPMRQRVKSLQQADPKATPDTSDDETEMLSPLDARECCCLMNAPCSSLYIRRPLSKRFDKKCCSNNETVSEQTPL